MKTYIARVTLNDGAAFIGATVTYKSVFAQSAEAATKAVQAEIPRAVVQVIDEREGNPHGLKPGVPT